MDRMARWPQRPKSKEGLDAITTWAGRLSRRVHFAPSRATDGAVECVRPFFAAIFKLHGLPDSIVSDRDPKLASKLWQPLMEMPGVKLKMPTSRHPQAGGSSEIMSRALEKYLRCCCNYRQSDWAELLPAAELAHSSALSEDLGASPLEMDLGWRPKEPLDMLSRAPTSVESLEEPRALLQSSLRDAPHACKEGVKSSPDGECSQQVSRADVPSWRSSVA